MTHIGKIDVFQYAFTRDVYKLSPQQLEVFEAQLADRIKNLRRVTPVQSNPKPKRLDGCEARDLILASLRQSGGKTARQLQAEIGHRHISNTNRNLTRLMDQGLARREHIGSSGHAHYVWFLVDQKERGQYGQESTQQAEKAE